MELNYLAVHVHPHSWESPDWVASLLILVGERASEQARVLCVRNRTRFHRRPAVMIRGWRAEDDDPRYYCAIRPTKREYFPSGQQASIQPSRRLVECVHFPCRRAIDLQWFESWPVLSDTIIVVMIIKITIRLPFVCFALSSPKASNFSPLQPVDRPFICVTNELSSDDNGIHFSNWLWRLNDRLAGAEAAVSRKSSDVRRNLLVAPQSALRFITKNWISHNELRLLARHNNNNRCNPAMTGRLGNNQFRGSENKSHCCRRRRRRGVKINGMIYDDWPLWRSAGRCRGRRLW